MHLRIELLRGGDGVRLPGHVVAALQVVGAVDGVPRVPAAGPGQLVVEGGQEVVHRPGHDGVVIEGDVESDDADREADTCGRREGTRGRVRRGSTPKMLALNEHFMSCLILACISVGISVLPGPSCK